MPFNFERSHTEFALTICSWHTRLISDPQTHHLSTSLTPTTALGAEHKDPQLGGLCTAPQDLGYDLAEKLITVPPYTTSNGTTSGCAATVSVFCLISDSVGRILSHNTDLETVRLHKAILGSEKVVEPRNPQYHSQNIYWSSIQSDVQPFCRAQPKNEIEVAVILVIMGFFSCAFAVKSGGHAPFAGASNIQGGVTIDLKQLNQIQVVRKTLWLELGLETNGEPSTRSLML